MKSEQAIQHLLDESLRKAERHSCRVVDYLQDIRNQFQGAVEPSEFRMEKTKFLLEAELDNLTKAVHGLDAYHNVLFTE